MSKEEVKGSEVAPDAALGAAEGRDFKVITNAIHALIRDHQDEHALALAETWNDELVEWTKGLIAARDKPLFISPDLQPQVEPTALERAKLTRDEQQALFKAVEEGLAQEKAGLPAVIAPPAPPVATTFDQALAEMNAQHAVIEAVGRKTVIATVKPGMFAWTEIVFQAVSDFELWYRNKTISIAVSGRRGTQTIPISKATWWLEQAGRREYHGVTFCPGGGAEVNGHLNLWQGWGIEKKQGNWRPILAHIVHVICDGNRVFAQYLVRWIAWSVQNPALQAEVLVALIGGKGTGKGTLGHVLQLMFRPHTFKVTSSDQVVGRFNAHLEGCVISNDLRCHCSAPDFCT